MSKEVKKCINKKRFSEHLKKLLRTRLGVSLTRSLIVFILVGSYGYINNSKLKNEIKSKNNEITKLNGEYVVKINSLNTELKNTKESLNKCNERLDEVKAYFTLSSDDQKLSLAYINDLSNKSDEKKRIKQEKLQAEQKVKEKAVAEERVKKEAEEKANKETEKYKSINTDKFKANASSLIQNEINDSLKNTKLDSININENLGIDSKDDVVVLVNLSWNTENGQIATGNVLKRYSGHIAATLAPLLENGSEVALFWKTEYTQLNTKYSYYIENKKAYEQ